LPVFFFFFQQSMDRFVQRTHRTEDSAVQALLALVDKKKKGGQSVEKTEEKEGQSLAGLVRRQEEKYGGVAEERWLQSLAA
jgi:hypothetical protein